jgi:hypothetical protein
MILAVDARASQAEYINREEQRPEPPLSFGRIGNSVEQQPSHDTGSDTGSKRRGLLDRLLRRGGQVQGGGHWLRRNNSV